MKKHYDVRIAGRVQGVYYRASTQQQAAQMGITGFVRNEPDGTVYAEIEGTPAQCQQLIDWCWQGPEHARVEEVSVTEGALKGYREFTIER